MTKQEEFAEQERYIAEGVERRATMLKMELDVDALEAARIATSNAVFTTQETQRKLDEEAKAVSDAKETAKYRKLADDRIASNNAEAARQDAENAKLRSLMQSTPEERVKRNEEADAICKAKARERQDEASAQYEAEREAQALQAEKAKEDLLQREQDSAVALRKIRERQVQEAQAYNTANNMPCASCGDMVVKGSALHLKDGVACYSDFARALAAGVITLEMYNKLTTKVHA
jgi:hypothetical protein